MNAKVHYQTRIEKLRKSVKNQCDAIVIDNPIDIFYLTGIHLSTGRLLVADETFIFVDGRYTEMCDKQSPFPVRSSKETLDQVLAEPAFHSVKKLAFDSAATPFSSYQKLEDSIKKIAITNPKHVVTLVPLEAPVTHVRAIKDTGEIQLLREAAILGSKGHDYVLTILKEEITEEEVAAELEIFWRRCGASGAAFDPIIAFGENSSMPHYRAGKRKLHKGDIVLIDIGVTLNGYHSDMTRTVFFGTPDPRLVAIHDVVCEAQQKSLKLCKPGSRVGLIDAAARDYIAAEGYGDKFNHGLGHGIGLEVHELPVLKNIPPYDNVHLEKGMAITVEPGIYLPGIGGVRIEDTIIITDDGYENLTQRPTSHQIDHHMRK